MEHKITKRNFLITAATATVAALTWEPLFSFSRDTATTTLRRLSLTGAWQLAQQGKEEWVPATVPGGVYTDLLAAGKIPDPFCRDNEKDVQWVGDADWIYRRTFPVPDDVLKQDCVRLHCEGLDTLATVKINGREIGTADNMFRLWEFDVKSALVAGQNTIEILFRSPAAYMKERDSDQEPQKWIKGRAWVRKEPCSYGWDWGPCLPACGIWRNISLETFNQARLSDVLVRQTHASQRVTLDVVANAESVREGTALSATFLVKLGNKKIAAKKSVRLANGQASAQIEIENPQLWWPAGMGEQPLYTVQVELLNADGDTLDSMTKRVGLRELKAVLPSGAMPLHFEINGVAFFAKGANWIPADSFATRVTPEISRRYVEDAAAVNMNFLRFWGGGYYEDDALFDACDELGICVWLDFKFACAAYPAFDQQFMENVKVEARDNLQRLRHHPCIAVWCGNNEISLSWWEGPTWGPNRMSTADYDKLFKDLLGAQVRQYAPDANYVSGSPDCGDTHYWEVWHGPKNFEAFRTQHGFMSEFGYQSFPELKTVKTFTNEADRATPVTPVMGWHQRSGGVSANQKIVGMTLNYFKPPRDFEMTLWLSQILQGFGIRMGAEYWRQTMPVSMGCVFWQYNDCWPAISWSSVDYFGRWKALHYLARQFYAPILISGLEHAEEGAIDVFVTSDRLTECSGRITWNVTDLAGKSVLKDSMDIKIPARKSQKIKTLDLHDQVQKRGGANLLTWLTVEVAGKVVSDNLVLLVAPKELALEDPQLTTTVEEAKGGFVVSIEAQKPALWVWVASDDTDTRCSHNFIHLQPGKARRITVNASSSMSKSQFVKGLKVRSLFDTYA